MPCNESAIDEFDKSLLSISKARGDVYGDPVINFSLIDQIKQAVLGCKDPLIRHALEMIAVKMARLVQNPEHLDSVIDIAGYARTIAMIIDHRRDHRGESHE